MKRHATMAGAAIALAALCAAGAALAGSFHSGARAASPSRAAQRRAVHTMTGTQTSTNSNPGSLTLSSPIVISVARQLGVTPTQLGAALDTTKRQVNAEQPEGGFANHSSAATFAHALGITVAQATNALAKLAPTP